MRKTVQIREKIEKEFPELNISLEKIELLDGFLQLLTKWNKKVNLTAIRSQNEMVVKHLFDALAVLSLHNTATNQPYLSGRVMDLGSGAGIPGIILAICDPRIHLTSLDKSGKKILFQETVIRSLRLSNIIVLKNRLENVVKNQKQKSRYDVIISRAFDQIKGVLTYSAPLLRPGGHIILWKGQNWSLEYDEVKEELKSQFTLCCTKPYRFMESGHGGVFLVFQKHKDGETNDRHEIQSE